MWKFARPFAPTARYASSLEISWKEGIPATLMQAVMDYYLIPLALFLGATPVQIGLLVAIPNLLGCLAQIFAVEMVNLIGSHLRFLVIAAAAQAAFLLPVALLPIFGFSFRLETLILLITFFRILAGVIGTVWSALVSNYLPMEERGKYFGWRMRIQGIAGVASIILGGLFLSWTKNTALALGFFLLFFFTSASRFVSSLFMARMENIPIRIQKESDFTLVMFLARFRESNFVKFVLYAACISFATNLASPYFSVYALKELHFSYLQYMTWQCISAATGLIAFPLWGRLADQVGNAKILRSTSFIVPLIPVLWLLTKNFYGILLIETIACYTWAGFNLCSLNFIYDAVSPEKRTRCLSYFYLINGIAIFFGASLGGVLAENLPRLLGSRFYSLFLLSGIFRAGSHFLLSKKFREVRANAQKMTSLELFFSVVGIKPLLDRLEAK